MEVTDAEAEWDEAAVSAQAWALVSSDPPLARAARVLVTHPRQPPICCSVEAAPRDADRAILLPCRAASSDSRTA